jgi:pimeloyl-ACP methyl ester carboxylesterase
MDTSAWELMLGKLSKLTRVCAYDRANVGQSDPAPTPRTVQQMADDLHALLHTAEVPGPYVLAAVSFGPLVSRMYASTYPEDVAGLVLIEGLSEDLVERWNEVLPPDLQERWIEDFWVGNPEEIALDESYTQVRESAPLPNVPLVVIVHGDVTRDDHLIPAGWPVEALDPIWTELVARQATLIPGGHLIVAEESGHSVEAEQPELVVAAIREVVEAARDTSTWASPVASPAP